MSKLFVFQSLFIWRKPRCFNTWGHYPQALAYCFIECASYSVSCFYDHHFFNTNNFVIYIPTVWFSISLYVQNMTCFILDDVCFARFKVYILCEWWQKQINLFYKNHFRFCWVFFFLEASDKKRWEKHCLSLKSILNLIIPVVCYRHHVKNWSHYCWYLSPRP